MGLVASKTPTAERNLWRTPQAVFDLLNKRYGPFTLDAAADETNHKCDIWLGPGSGKPDALVVDWCNYDGSPARVFCNPPYDHTAEFIAKAWEEVDLGHVYSVTLLVPNTTDVKWFHRWCWQDGKPRPDTIVDFYNGRIRFERPDGTPGKAPRSGNMFITFRKEGQGKLF